MALKFWHVELFGGLKARFENREITRFPTRKVAALLAYLAYYKDRPHTREELVDRFWPDLEMDAARHNLRQTLFSLRRCLDPSNDDTPLFFADRTTIQLNHERIITDVGRFEQAVGNIPSGAAPMLRQQALLGAIDLYRGELLPGHYEEWIFTERERLTASYGQALRQTLAISEQVGDWQRAISLAHRLIAANNLDESAHQALIRLYLATGQPGNARRQYVTLRQLLRTEFGVTPSLETQALLAGLMSSLTDGVDGSSAPPTAIPQASTTPVFDGNTAAPPLPLPLDRFFGRENEIYMALQSLSATSRLLTLTGPGGSGKSRLAIEIAHCLARRSGQAVYFLALADLTDARAMPMQLAAALGLPPAEQADPLTRITAHLDRVPSYLILDNFEHLVDTGAELLATLLQRAPALRCLVTSRRRLGLAGEHETLVPPLPTPQREEDLKRLPSIASVALYIDRVRLLRPHFALTPENARAVAALCDQLEGIPLAIELAAARSGVLSPAQMLAQLEDRFRILVAPRRAGAVARHRSLRAALDVSYDLLPPEAQRLFCQLTLFRGGWTLEAAEAVTGQRDEALLGGLEQLRASSLITTVEAGGGLRFRMLETLREYGRERSAPGELTLPEARHTDHYLHLAEAAALLYPGPAVTVAFDALEADHDNLRAALDSAARQDKPPAILLRLTVALWRFWLMRGHYQEGLDWLQTALDRSSAAGEDGTDALHAGAIYGLGVLKLAHGDIAGQEVLEDALAFFRSLGDRRHIAVILLRLGRLATSQDDAVRAHNMLQEGLAIGRQLQDRQLIADALYQLSYEAREQGDAAAAWKLLQECLTHAQQLGNKEFLGDVLNWLGTVALLQGDILSARHYHNRAITLYREANYDKGLGWALLGLGNVERAEANVDAARSVFADSLRCFHRLNDRVGMFHSLLRCAYVEAMQANHLRAAHLLSAAETLRRETGFLVQPSERPDRDRCLSRTQAALDARVFALAWSEAEGWPLTATIRYALAN